MEKCKCYPKNSDYETWRQRNPEKEKEIKRKSYLKNKDKINIKNKEWQKNNLEKFREYNRRFRKNNPERAKEHSKKWREKNKEKIKISSILYREKNKEKIKKYRREHKISKYKNIPRFRTYEVLSRAIFRAIKDKKAGRKWESLVGYTIDDLMVHLESKFESWMSWENYGKYEEGKLKWHIDHIIPQSVFKYETAEDEEFKKCWALENLQPLEAVENMKKGRKIIKDYECKCYPNNSFYPTYCPIHSGSYHEWKYGDGWDEEEEKNEE
jgi:hypothetical protein